MKKFESQAEIQNRLYEIRQELVALEQEQEILQDAYQRGLSHHAKQKVRVTKNHGVRIAAVQK